VELATVLRKFYAEARKKDGQMYSKNSLCSVRFALSRHVKQELNVDIIKDVEFKEANRVYEAQCVELKKQGLAKTEHKLQLLTKTSRNYIDVVSLILKTQPLYKTRFSLK